MEIFNRELSDTIMNVVGAFMWVSVGATALHYWQGFMADHDQLGVNYERTVNERAFFFYSAQNCFIQSKHMHNVHLILIRIGRVGARFLMRTRRGIVCD